MVHYKTDSGIRAIGESHDIDGDQSELVQPSWVLMTVIEVEAHINPPKTPEQLLVTLKAVKDKAVADKLTLMQYDALTTVKLWADDAVYGTEATAILNWYKAVTVMSIQLENDVKAGTVPMPTEAEYKTMIEGVV